MTLPSDSFDHAWERRLHKELRELPELEAPTSLIPNVMAAIQARQNAVAVAWFRRPATTWPPAMRIALAVSALAVLVLAALGVQAVWPQIAASAETGWLASFGRTLGSIWAVIRPLLNAFALVMREALSSPWVIGAVAASACAYVALLGAGSALWRMVLHPKYE